MTYPWVIVMLIKYKQINHFYILGNPKRCFTVLLGLFKLRTVFAVVDQMEVLSYQTLNELNSIQDLVI